MQMLKVSEGEGPWALEDGCPSMSHLVLLALSIRFQNGR